MRLCVCCPPAEKYLSTSSISACVCHALSNMEVDSLCPFLSLPQTQQHMPLCIAA